MEDIIINFIYNGETIKIHSKRNESMENILQRLYAKLDNNEKEFVFLYNGKNIDENFKISELNEYINEFTILVYDNDTTIINNKKFCKSIICPECGEDCIINIKDYKINLNQCDNGHNSNIILLSELDNIQKSEEAKINCNSCQKNISKTFDKIFYKCCKCQINLCPMCKAKHNQEHIILDFNSKNYKCNLHGERYILYCKNCHKNLCDICELEHDKNHNIISHKEILSNKDYKQNLNDLKIKINELNSFCEELINKIKIIINNYEAYYELCFQFINNYDKKNRNYQTLINLNNIFDNNLQFQKDIKNILEENNFINKIKKFKNI